MSCAALRHAVGVAGMPGQLRSNAAQFGFEVRQIAFRHDIVQCGARFAGKPAETGGDDQRKLLVAHSCIGIARAIEPLLIQCHAPFRPP